MKEQGRGGEGEIEGIGKESDADSDGEIRMSECKEVVGQGLRQGLGS